jgi:chromosome segregation ATPase
MAPSPETWQLIVTGAASALGSGALLETIRWLLGKRERHVNHASRLVDASGKLADQWAVLVNELEEMRETLKEELEKQRLEIAALRESQAGAAAEWFAWKQEAQGRIAALERENEALRAGNAALRAGAAETGGRLAALEGEVVHLRKDYMELQWAYLRELRKSQFLKEA